MRTANSLSGEYPSKLIALPDWSKFDRLFNENLMKLSTVFFDDEYTDYDTYSVGNFICKFRNNYGTEPKDIAYHGFNIGWYFLNALMNYGDNVKDASPYTTLTNKSKQGLHKATLYDEITFENTSDHEFKFVVLDPAASTNAKYNLQFDCITFIPITE